MVQAKIWGCLTTFTCMETPVVANGLTLEKQLAGRYDDTGREAS